MELSQKRQVEESRESLNGLKKKKSILCRKRWGLVSKYRRMKRIKEDFLMSGGGEKAEGQGRAEHKMISMQCNTKPVGHQVRPPTGRA